MKLTVLSDIHGDLTRLVAATPLLSGSDLVVIAGDLSRHGDPDELKSVLEALQSVGTVLAIPGNMDGRASIDILRQLNVNLHDDIRIVDGICLSGAGGSTPTPFGTPFESPETEIVQMLDRHFSTEPDIRNVTVCHTPPYGTTVDRVMLGRHVGGRLIREWIETNQPEIFLCGHIHEGVGVDRIGKTVILNPGPFRRGGVGVISISGTAGVSAEVVYV